MSSYARSRSNEAEAPLLLNAHVDMISESTNTTPALSKKDFGNILSTGSMLGCVLGLVAPFCALATSFGVGFLFAKVRFFQVDQPVAVCSIVWGVLVTAVVFYVQTLLYKALAKRYHELPEDRQELIKLRVSLGTLTGVLVAWAITCVLLGFGFWDRIVIASAVLTAVLWYCEQFVVQRGDAASSEQDQHDEMA